MLYPIIHKPRHVDSGCRYKGKQYENDCVIEINEVGGVQNKKKVHGRIKNIASGFINCLIEKKTDGFLNRVLNCIKNCLRYLSQLG